MDSVFSPSLIANLQVLLNISEIEVNFLLQFRMFLFIFMHSIDFVLP